MRIAGNCGVAEAILSDESDRPGFRAKQVNTRGRRDARRNPKAAARGSCVSAAKRYVIVSCESLVMRSDADVAASSYELAEHAYLAALQANEGRAALAAAAERVAEAAKAWNTACYSVYFALRDATGNAQLQRNADNEAERTEVLSEMWRDIAAAYTGRWERPSAS